MTKIDVACVVAILVGSTACSSAHDQANEPSSSHAPTGGAGGSQPVVGGGGQAWAGGAGGSAGEAGHTGQAASGGAAGDTATGGAAGDTATGGAAGSAMTGGAAGQAATGGSSGAGAGSNGGTSAGSAFAVGPWAAPIQDVGASERWSGAEINGWLSADGNSSADMKNVLPKLSTAKARVFLSILRNTMTNVDGTLSVTNAKQELDGWKSHVDLDKYFVDGTVLGVVVIDDVGCPACWGGTNPTVTQIESIGQYVKQLWPHARVAMRAKPDWGAPHVWQHMDVAWAQYNGPYRDGTPSSYIAAQTNAANAAKLGLVMGLNVLDGGCGPASDTVSGSKCLPGIAGTGIWGTYANSPSVHRYQMSAAEMVAYGKAFVAEPYNCALLAWRYSTTYNCTSSKYTPAQCQGIMAFDARPDVIAAWDTLVKLGHARSAGACSAQP
jgi:hypothetical protein